MADIKSRISGIYSLEHLASGDTVIHGLHPGVKIIVTFVYIVCIVSLERHSPGRLAPFFMYPVLMMILAEIPPGMIAPRAAAALPFCIFAGVSNLIFEREVLLYIGAFGISAGLMSFAVLLIRTFMCVSAVLILMAATPFAEVAAQLRRMHIPELAVTLFEMIYRYITVLAEEASSMLTAYRLRGNGAKWPEIKHFGSFIGQLLLRSADRAERIYSAMQCRCYSLRASNMRKRRMTAGDIIFVIAAAGSSVLFRFCDIPALLGTFMETLL